MKVVKKIGLIGRVTLYVHFKKASGQEYILKKVGSEEYLEKQGTQWIYRNPEIWFHNHTFEANIETCRKEWDEYVSRGFYPVEFREDQPVDKVASGG
jgi:hypothetical protein